MVLTFKARIAFGGAGEGNAEEGGKNLFHPEMKLIQQYTKSTGKRPSILCR
jgi:hypothetical protein